MLTSVAGLVMTGAVPLALAQTVLPPNQPVPYVVNNQGGNAGPGSDNYTENGTAGTGGQGGAGTQINIEIPAGASLVSSAGSGTQPTIGLDASGGSGGTGGTSANCSACDPIGLYGYGNGGAGGPGGNAAPITVTLDASGSPGTTLTNQGTGQVLLLTSNGGAGGTGGTPANRGTAGGSGAAGTAGALQLTINPGATLSSTGAGTNAVELDAFGGNGGNGGEDTQTHTDHAYGPSGAPGQAGGTITANVNGTIRSQGSGIVANATGGSGGYGAEAGSDTGSATGGSGGAGGAGGTVFLNLTGGSVSAAGASGPGTGETINVDTSGGGTTTAHLSVQTVALGAFSFGGVGGYGDYGGAGFGSGKGGGGGAAGPGGQATVNVTGASLSTTGYAAIGALALSVGGSGGNGGSAGAIFSRSGGSGGAGGAGGVAGVNLGGGGSVTTTGRNADAAVALSIGGGGGVGGDVTGGGAGISISLGGQGGLGGDGQVASVLNGYYVQNNDGTWSLLPGNTISTTGSYARGLTAASIGGGGGRGGDASGANLGLLSLTIGGNGGVGGQGGQVTATNFGVIQTRGNNSVGIDAGSFGGGGGAGGAANSYDVGSAFTASVAVGGAGGGCGTVNGATDCPTGGTVSVLNYGQILTKGSDAHGIRAQSIGGGGGAGGASVSETLSLNEADEVPTVNLNSSVGGSGGKGGDGGLVTALNAGMIITQGTGAAGILAQSVGGGGGTGGDSSATSQSIGPTTLSITTALGGSGGAGGAGNAVNVYNSGFIWTLNDQAPGIVAQSVGGGGGNGGYGKAHTGSVGGGVAPGSGGSGSGMTVNLSVGGSGGAGGDGGAVSVYNYVTAANTPDGGPGGAAGIGAGGITTLGDASDGIYAHSIGGGGGNGGNGTAAGGKGKIVVNVSVGGSGGAAGNGGSVLVDNGTGTILTYGASSNGIFAQSVGGGGGRGGNGGSSAVGDPQYGTDQFMSQGLGLSGNVVQVANGVWKWGGQITNAFNQISTLQSIVNGYGSNNVQGYDPAPSNSSSTSMSVKIGAGLSGAGGAGGNGGTVTVNNAGIIQTSGPLSAGIFAQSIGGGGGAGGASNPAMDSSNVSQSSASVSFSIGGQNGASGYGGAVGITNTGPITTGGDVSPAILAQSVGGGGGYGATTVMTSGTGTVASVTLGANGSTSKSWNSDLSGGSVTVTAGNAALTTTGNDAPAILAQSAGGGGGITAVMAANYLAETGKWTSSSVLASMPQTTAQQTFFQFNGNAPSGSGGGPVTVTLQNGASISTQGQNAYGILAQSVGNGGGIIVSEYRVTTDSFFNSYAGASNNGGTVTVNTDNTTQITTSGGGAVGILAQSAGGGGLVNGMYGAQLSSNYAQGTASSYGGNVTVNNSANITTTGPYAHGIFAQSVAMGGVVGQGDQTGFVFSSAATSCTNLSNCGNLGNVTVNLNAGTVQVSGAHAYGVVLISQGNPPGPNTSPGDNNTNLYVNAGSKIVATGSAAGAAFIGGSADNYIQVSQGGVIDASQSASQVALDTWTNNPAVAFWDVENGGTLKGSINLFSEYGSTLTNQVTGRLEAGPVVNLGTRGVLTNLGTLSVGAVGQIATTTVTGQLVQGVTGRLVVDTDHAAGRADQLTVQGSAQLAGTVEVHAASVSKQPVAVLTATGGLTVDPGLTGTRTFLVNYLPQSDGTTLRIQPQADFRTAGGSLTGTQAAVAGHLQEIWDAGSALGGGFGTLAGITDAAGYQHALNSLSGQTLGAVAAYRYNTSRNFVTNLFDCPTSGPSGTVQVEGSCSWLRAYGNETAQDSTGSALGYRAATGTLQIGGQWEFAPGWFAGASAAYETSRFKGNDGSATVTGDGFLLGAELKHQSGRWLFSGAIEGGYGWYNSKRPIAVGSLASTAQASPSSWHVSLDTEVSYQIPFRTWYLKPKLDLNAIHVGSSAYTETGAGAFNLAVDSGSGTAVTTTAAIEAGTQFALRTGGTLRPFASAGIGVIGADGWSTTARFANAPAATSGFRAKTPIPTVLGRFAVGADLLASANWDVRLQYSADLADNYTSQTGLVRLSYRF